MFVLKYQIHRFAMYAFAMKPIYLLRNVGKISSRCYLKTVSTRETIKQSFKTISQSQALDYNNLKANIAFKTKVYLTLLFISGCAHEYCSVRQCDHQTQKNQAARVFKLSPAFNFLWRMISVISHDQNQRVSVFSQRNVHHTITQPLHPYSRILVLLPVIIIIKMQKLHQLLWEKCVNTVCGKF